VRSGRFVTVPDLTVARYMEIRTIRMELEGLAADLAATNATAAQVKDMPTCRRGSRPPITHACGHRSDPINREFHFRVYDLSAMPMLVAHIESLWISMGPILNVFYNEVENDYVGAEAHRHLIKALRAKDGRRRAPRSRWISCAAVKRSSDYLKRRDAR
jgi:DNA-binding GntR family transcriptional regulator